MSRGVLEKKIKFVEPIHGPGLILAKFLIKQISSATSKAWPCIDFRTLLTFTCFSYELLVHINENVSFQHVAFLCLIHYGNLHRKCLN